VPSQITSKHVYGVLCMLLTVKGITETIQF